jgi:hypothetical protein
MAVGWRRLDQDEPFMARAGDVGDDLGSRLIAAGQIGNVIRLCFLMEKEYAPYSKWLGTAFSQLDCAPVLAPFFMKTLKAKDWGERQDALSKIYETLANMHNQLGITQPLDAEVSQFHNRPYLVIHSERFVRALIDSIKNDEVKALPTHLGGIDQFVNSTDVLAYPERFQRIRDMIRRLSENAG